MNSRMSATVWDWLNTALGVINPISKLTALAALAAALISGRKEDIKSDRANGCFDLLNQNEQKALEAKVLGFYKGSTVVRRRGLGTFSVLGTIWADRYTDCETVRHEYGHSVQERFLPVLYLTRIALPSVIYFWCRAAKKKCTSFDYYSTPWERTADWLGGSKRRTNYKRHSLAWALSENLLGVIVIPLYFAFGYNKNVNKNVNK